LNSTVTAGIVSAKARNINILRSREYGIESFIQTDAVVNPGNSGGALVNLRGELIGINTAIASPTGSYTGYSFAVPVSLVKKVMDDLLEFGTVQRALLGISIRDLNADLARELGIKETSGVYIASVNIGSSAQEAG
jgi:serine protease Do